MGIELLEEMDGYFIKQDFHVYKLLLVMYKESPFLSLGRYVYMFALWKGDMHVGTFPVFTSSKEQARKKITNIWRKRR